MNELPPQPTPQQSYGQQESQQSHHHNVNRKYPPQSHQIPQKVTYRPPPQQQQPPPQQQYQQYTTSSHQDYYQHQQPSTSQNYQLSGHYAPPQQYANQQHASPPPQQYSNQPPPPPQVNYQQRPSYSLAHSSQQQVYQQQQQQPPPPPQQQFQPPPSNNGHYSKRNASKDSLESAKTTSSSKQKLEAELRVVFEKVDVNRSGRISAKELSYALLNFDRTRFQDSTIRLMINLFSTSDSSSKSLSFEQFVSLWKYLSAYKKLFIQADTNKSGDISFGEFQKILEQIGYKLDIDLVLHLFQRYAMHENGGVGKLKFDNFIELLVYLRKLTDVFKKYDKDLSGTATISFSNFLFEVSNLS
ncbi:Peflin [Candida viswanathii]|uniref:Peflin n=1 Tax=Candida viswanathii TaxID=5486 RepID=A0A367XMU3_9ASCO|nr:Peflin [Candida viswanathii]